jgi:hypothetical protein
MRESPDARALRAFLARALRRATVLAALRGAAVALGIAGVLTLAGILPARSPGVALASALVALAAGGSAGALIAARRSRHVTALIERRAPASRNLVITAAELVDRPSATPPYVVSRVLHDAAELTGALDLTRTLPARRTAIGLATGVAVWLAAVTITMTGLGRSAGTAGARPGPDAPASIAAIEIRVTPPPYSGLPSRTLGDPSRIEAFAGSQLHVTVTASAVGVTMERVSGTQPLAARGTSFTGDLIADADGFLAIAAVDRSGQSISRRLIGLSVTPDRAPRVRVTAPGRDLLFAHGRRTVDLAIEADDDLGLESLEVRYTKVQGAGENFSFIEGELPLAVVRANDRSWTGRGALRLEPLALEAGDMVIYRGVARDRRPGAPPALSDTFIIEIAAPGALASEGFAMDDRQDRYAISQQMVIVKTERLIARRASLPAADLADEASSLAAEQRQVRAEFVFMMGGELADAGLDLTTLNEVQEAERESDLAAGYLVNQGRADLIRAIRAMSHASTLLDRPELAGALAEEKTALTYLQRAFARSRYILRALTTRERLDLSRRLTGVLAAIARGSRPAVEADATPRVTALRTALAELAALIGDTAGLDAAANRVTALAQAVLRVDPASEPVRAVAADLTAAAGQLNGGARDRTTARETLGLAAVSLAAVVRSELVAAAHRPASLAARQLDGALADALRPKGSPR